jgi:NADPH:quinone reductase-like Zn-dependent oxidoreductase
LCPPAQLPPRGSDPTVRRSSRKDEDPAERHGDNEGDRDFGTGRTARPAANGAAGAGTGDRRNPGARQLRRGEPAGRAAAHGRYPPPKGASDIPGLEISGTVEACGPGASKFSAGDQVCALVPGGGYAEFAVAHESNTLPVPRGFTFAEAAAIPETYFTVWHNVFQRGGLKAGETLLVHGGTSGIGTTAIQLAKAFGATVITTAGSAEKCAAAEKLGADRAINYREADFVAAVKEATDGKGADVILDMVGGDYITRNYQAAAVEGRIVQIAFLAGRASLAAELAREGLAAFRRTQGAAGDGHVLSAARGLAGA